MKNDHQLTRNEQGFWTPPNPLRFLSFDQAQAYLDHKIDSSQIPIVGTPEYENAPIELGYVIDPRAFETNKPTASYRPSPSSP